MAALSHSLLGACQTVGAVSLAGVCRDLETRAKGASLPPARETLAQFQREYESLREIIGAYVETLGNQPVPLLDKM